MPNRTAITDEGTGSVVLCLHGFPQSAAAFDGLAAQLVQSGYRVVRFNQRGYEGVVLKRRDYVVQRLAADATAVLDQLGVQECIVVGHDLGGMVAVELARLEPQRVRHLFVLSVPHPAAFLVSLLGVKQLLRSWYFILAQSTALAKLVFSPDRSPSRERFLSRLASTGLRREEASICIEYLTGERFVGAIRWYQAMPFSPLRSTFHVPTVPCTLVWGESDAITTGLSVKLSRLFTDSKKTAIERIPSAGHWLLDYNAPDIARLIRDADPDYAGR